MYLSTLSEWLDRIGSVHSVEIDLGLERVKKIAAELALLTPSCPVIIVGGTNGKGSTVAGLEAIYRAAAYHTGCFTSPILFKHNEYVRIDGENASDEAFCEAYGAIERVRGVTPLTPFEFHTLAALWMFKRANLDVILLEVGLGGRLDAVNIVDSDVAVITSVSLDHTEWLGETLEKIGYEKAGIFRKGKAAVCGREMPLSVIEQATEKGAILLREGKEFSYDIKEESWNWRSLETCYTYLPICHLHIKNMSLVLMVITLLQEKLPVIEEAIKHGLAKAALPGRLQRIPGKITTILDVSHNPGSIALLAEKLKSTPCQGKTIAVFSMLADKDIETCITIIKDQIDNWCIAPLKTPRAASVERMEEILKENNIHKIDVFSSISKAYQFANRVAQSGDRVIVFGSFHTVSEYGAKND